jgi:hypothetical protein
MATPNLSLTLPVVGGSANQWGTILNTDLGIIDNVFAGGGTGTSVGLNIGDGKTLAVTGNISVTGANSIVTLPAKTSTSGTFIGGPTYTISSATVTSNTATLTISSGGDTIPPGTSITVAGVTNAVFNGTFTTTAGTSTTVSYGLVAVDGTNGSGGTVAYSLTIATTSGVQTFYGKTLVSPTLTGTVGGNPTFSSIVTFAANVFAPAVFLRTSAGGLLGLTGSDGNTGFYVRTNVSGTTNNGLTISPLASGSIGNAALTITSNGVIQAGAATGSGALTSGAVNATGYYVNGAALSSGPLSAVYDSGFNVIAMGNVQPFNYPGGVLPKIMSVYFYCRVATNGYSVGDYIWGPPSIGSTDGGNNYGYSVSWRAGDASRLYVAFVNGAGALRIPARTSPYNFITVNASNWYIGVRVYY